MVLNDEIHLLGAKDGNGNLRHYVFNSTTNEWTIKPNVLPKTSMSSIVYNNKIHLLGGLWNATDHYVFNNTTNEWESDIVLPYDFNSGNIIIYNDEIHIMGSNLNNNEKSHYKLNKDTNEWENQGLLEYGLINNGAVVYKNGIHILGCSYTDSVPDYTVLHYRMTI